MEEKEVPTLPRLNGPAPDFTAKTTLGEIRLSHFKGKWVASSLTPNGILRGMPYYPLTTGRNVEEILRSIRALQLTDRTGPNAPAD